MLVKRYNLRNAFRLETTVTVNDDQVRISFDGGSKYQGDAIRLGYYMTGNKEVQDALESDIAYGSQWVLAPGFTLNSDTTDVPEIIEPIDVVKETQPEVHEVPETEVPDVVPTEDETTVNTEEITNYTEAKLLIQSLFPEVTRQQIISADKLRDFAKEKGLTFPNWK